VENSIFSIRMTLCSQTKNLSVMNITIDTISKYGLCNSNGKNLVLSIVYVRYDDLKQSQMIFYDFSYQHFHNPMCTTGRLLDQILHITCVRAHSCKIYFSYNSKLLLYLRKLMLYEKYILQLSSTFTLIFGKLFINYLFTYVIFASAIRIQKFKNNFVLIISYT